MLGFGTGNLKDSTMEKLADKGNGNYAYIDSLHEARKVLVREAGGTLGDDRQGREDPGRVQSRRRWRAYRLIGYENRLLRQRGLQRRQEGRRRDRRRALGDGALRDRAGGRRGRRAGVDPLKYQRRRASRERGRRPTLDELMTVKLRYKEPDGDTSRLISRGAAQRGRSR